MSNEISSDPIGLLINMMQHLNGYRGLANNAGINSIMEKLDQSIEKLKNNGEDSNGKINTNNEKNQLAQLLSGAEKELESYIENNQISEDLPHSEYVQLQKDFEAAVDAAMSKINNIKLALNVSLRAYEKIENGKIVEQDGIIRKYEDGSYDDLIEKFEDGSYTACIKDKFGKIQGYRYYKSDTEVYVSPDAVAEKLEMYKSKDTGLYEKSGDLYRWDDDKKAIIYDGPKHPYRRVDITVVPSMLERDHINKINSNNYDVEI